MKWVHVSPVLKQPPGWAEAEISAVGHSQLIDCLNQTENNCLGWKESRQPHSPHTSALAETSHFNVINGVRHCFQGRDTIRKNPAGLLFSSPYLTPTPFSFTPPFFCLSLFLPACLVLSSRCCSVTICSFVCLVSTLMSNLQELLPLSKYLLSTKARVRDEGRRPSGERQRSYKSPTEEDRGNMPLSVICEMASLPAVIRLWRWALQHSQTRSLLSLSHSPTLAS